VPTLVLLRHAKSAYPDGVDDHERPLNARGERDARRVGELLSESYHFDRVLVSTAARAQQTWQMASRAMPGQAAETLSRLYLATSGELLDIVRGLPTDTDAALVVGHNEGLEQCASGLCGVPTVLKTSTFAVVTSRLPWQSWSWGTAHLDGVVRARG
jgi:phosphohistidine phosphatase